MQNDWDQLWINARITNNIINKTNVNSFIAVKNNIISTTDTMNNLPANIPLPDNRIYDLSEKYVTPGFIDCHTHIVYGGNRANEFSLRLNGISYEEIAKNGGGILSTVKKTREASENELYEYSARRIFNLINEGVTTIEIKSGYGLNIEDEIKMLKVAKKLENNLPIRVKTTFLGAHTIPPEFKNNRDDYIKLITEQILPIIAEQELADAIDGFCENIAFTTAEIETIFKTAQQYQLDIKLHAEQLSHSGGTALAAKYKAISVDHLEYINEEDVILISESGTVAVLLPGAFYFLKETKYPPIDLLRKYNIPMAIASDCNPGSSPIESLLLIMNMGCVIWNLTPNEVFLGTTKNAAKALNCHDRGEITAGKLADFNIWNVSEPTEIIYNIGSYKPNIRVFNGLIM